MSQVWKSKVEQAKSGDFYFKYLSQPAACLNVSILLALFLFPEKENMGSNFYYGAIIILFSVFLNGILKNKEQFKKALQKKWLTQNNVVLSYYICIV